MVLDSNAFWGDVHARRPQLSAVFAGAAAGDFEVVVPDVVLKELLRQYPDRIGAALRETAKALRPLLSEFDRLGLERPAVPEPDTEQLRSAYEPALRARLSGAGVVVANHPDLTPTTGWAVDRRKPFKPTGQGLPDAIVWLTVLELADRAGSVVLVTANTADFAQDLDPGRLHEDLLGDLRDRGIPEDRVRLVSSVPELIEQAVKPLAVADVRAARLVGDDELSSRLISAIEERLLYEPLSQEDLELDVGLDDDPQAASVGVERLEVGVARELEDGRLLLEITATATTLLDMYIFKADAYGLAPESGISIVDWDWNDHFVQAEMEIVIEASLEVATDVSVTNVDVELRGVVRAPIEELAESRLDASGREAAIAALPPLLSEPPVSGYRPPQQLEADIEDAVLTAFSGETVELVSVELANSLVVECSIAIRGMGDVAWTVTAPSSSDLVAWAGAVEGDVGGGGWIASTSESEPIVVLATGFLDAGGHWHELSVESVMLDSAVAKERAQ